ncbi:hypothetical protein OROMI_003744 [Orobanche minor]
MKYSRSSAVKDQSPAEEKGPWFDRPNSGAWKGLIALRMAEMDVRSDVFSFGVILWELMTQSIPWSDLNSLQFVGVVGFMDSILDIPEAMDPRISSVINYCWQRVSLILRGANDYMLDEVVRALHDALCIGKRTLESNTVLAGGGAAEAALSAYLETLGSREQLAISEFAESLLIIPKFATEADITILWIDDMIKIVKDEGQNDE